MRMLMVSASLVTVLFLNGCATIIAEQEHDQKVAEVNTKLGMGYYQQGRLDEALKKLKKAIDAESDYAPAQSTIALVYDRMAMPDKAEQHYLKAIDLDPKNGSVYNNYGVFLCRVNRLKEADTYFMKAIQTPRYPTPERAYENAGACARRIPDLDKAEDYLRKALSRNSKLPVALYNMAEISFARERFLSTRAYLERYAEVAKPTPESLWLGVRAERKLGNKQGAQQYAKLLQTNYPDSLQFKWLLDSEEGDHKP